MGKGKRTPLNLDALRRDIEAGVTVEDLAAARDLDPAVMAEIIDRLGITRPDAAESTAWMTELRAAVLEARRSAGLTITGMSTRMGRHHMEATFVEANFFGTPVWVLLRYLDVLGLALAVVRQTADNELPATPQGRDVLPIGWVPRNSTPDWADTIMDTLSDHKKRKGLFQHQVADAMGVHQGTVSRLERDYPHVRASTLFAYARALGLQFTVGPDDG